MAILVFRVRASADCRRLSRCGGGRHKVKCVVFRLGIPERNQWPSTHDVAVGRRPCVKYGSLNPLSLIATIPHFFREGCAVHPKIEVEIYWAIYLGYRLFFALWIPPLDIPL